MVLIIFTFIIFYNNFIFFEKDKLPSVLTFPKSSLILFALTKNCLMWAKSSHTIHCGCSSCLSMKECVFLVWQIPYRDRSLLNFLKTGFYSPGVSVNRNDLLDIIIHTLFVKCRQLDERKKQTNEMVYL